MSKKKCFTTLIVLTIGVVFAIDTSFAQVLKVIDRNSKEAIPYVLVQQQDIVSDTDVKGEINIKSLDKTKPLQIKKLGYNDLEINFPKSDTVVYLALKTFGLPEVLVSSPSTHTSIEGNYGKYGFGDWSNSNINRDDKFTLVNKLICDSPTKITALLFFVSKDENYNHSNSIGTLEIVFFKPDLNNMPAKLPFVNFTLSKYSTGWNKIVLNNTAEIDNVVGTLFYGIRWVYHPSEYHYQNSTKKKTYYFFGPKIGIMEVDKKVNNLSPTYFYTSTYGWRKATLSNAMIALEISK